MTLEALHFTCLPTCMDDDPPSTDAADAAGAAAGASASTGSADPAAAWVYDAATRSVDFVSLLRGLPLAAYEEIERVNENQVWSQIGGGGGSAEEQVVAAAAEAVAWTPCFTRCPALAASAEKLLYVLQLHQQTAAPAAAGARAGAGAGSTAAPISRGSLGSRSVQARGSEGPPPLPRAPSAHAHPPRSRLATVLRARQAPTIVVPTAATAPGETPEPGMLVNSNNALAFLENGELFGGAAALPPGAGGRKAVHSESGATVVRELSGSPVKFRVVSATCAQRFDRAGWAAVVAVVLTSKAWQAGGWPVAPPEAFRRARGFYFAWSDESLPPCVTEWRAQVLRVSRLHRHNDAALSHEFWAQLNSFLHTTQ